MLLGLPDHLAAVAQGAGRPALDAFRVGIESDAQEGLALAGKRAEALEVAHVQKS